MPVYYADVDDVEAVVRNLRLSAPGPLVFTNGVFDILHRGHVACLEAARALGSRLVVALNSDSSARSLEKGVGRPFIDELSRSAVVAALRAVDAVFIFDTTKPLDVLGRVRPDVYVKGGDYDVGRLEETALVESWGGYSVAIPIEHDQSTTGIAARIFKALRPD